MKRTLIALIAFAFGCVLHTAAAQSATEKVLYSFQNNGTDGSNPDAGVIDVNGTLFGTTMNGPAGGCSSADGCGTLFSLDPATGVETVLHLFGKSTDGANPTSLLNVKNRLYGVTAIGIAGGGTVYSFDLNTAAEKVLYNFCSQLNCADGAIPVFGMLDLKGTLYGTTGAGGATQSGVLFSLDPKSRAETVLHSFGSHADGAYPDGNLIYVRDKLYGTTSAGGTGDCYNGSICGTVFSFKLKSNAETVLYSFQGTGGDGGTPIGGLINVKGTFYGTTSAGGAEEDSCGTVFSVNPKTGAETVLHSFGNGTDGCRPYDGLINVQGTLYGITEYGGNAICSGNTGCGTVFSFDLKTGMEAVLYSFGGTDGEMPSGSLINVKGTLYGTTYAGGTYGYGTVFSVVP